MCQAMRKPVYAFQTTKVLMCLLQNFDKHHDQAHTSLISGLVVCCIEGKLLLSISKFTQLDSGFE